MATITELHRITWYRTIQNRYDLNVFSDSFFQNSVHLNTNTVECPWCICPHRIELLSMINSKLLTHGNL